MLFRSKQRLAFQIAITASIEVIDSASLEIERDGEKWRDLEDDEFDTLADLADEIAFLTSIGRLRRHPASKHLVQILEAVNA